MSRTTQIIVLSLLIFSSVNAVGKRGNYIRKDDGVVVTADSLNIQLHVLGEKIIHVECIPIHAKQRHRELVVVKPSLKKTPWKLTRSPGSVVLSTASLQAAVDLSSGKIRFRAASGETLLEEIGRELIPATVLGEKTYTIAQKFILSPDEALYGLGQHQEGNMNLRGKTVELYQVNMKVSVPMLVSSKGYGILWDNYSLSKFTDKSDGMELWSEVADGIDYYFIAGKNTDEVISGYRKLTGQAPLYPKWAYGFFQSKERYKTQDEVLGIVDEFRGRQIPLDVIVQDWYYWEPQKWGSHYMNRNRYPDPVKMTSDVHNKNAKIIISVWAKFDSTSSNYSEMNRGGFLLPRPNWETSRYYNAFDPGARSLYWRLMNDSLFAKGFDGWWLDASEPEIGDLRNDGTKKLMNNALGTGARYLNAYPLMTTAAVYDGQRKASSEKRVYILTRSAFPGQQRNAATTWSGDITASWDVFHKQIPAGLNFCFTGIPYWTTDIGGFTVRVPGGCNNDMYRELFTRWYQYGTFCPIFRVHGSSTPREMWRFGDTSSWSYDTQLKFNNLRYRLMPYIYSLGWKVTHNNYTIMRGLVFDFADDSKVYSIDDQFMFGPSILVNPVLEAMYHPWGDTDSGRIISSKNLLDMNGHPGLTGEYYEGMNFNRLFTTRSDQTIDIDWGEHAPIQGMAADTFSIRWKGKLIAPETGEYIFNTLADDGTRLFINNKLIVDNWQDQAPLIASGKIVLEAGKTYNVMLEYYENRIGAVAQLRWVLPSEQKVSTIKLPGKTRKVYLPGTTRWIDFWTGKTFTGGESIITPAPIDIMPLFVKAGAIIPMGPYLQYATEKPADPVELRIYPGADGTFELYEDENDNYNYEKGKYTLIPFSWNDRGKTLTIGERRGTFKGMLKERTINVVLVNGTDGVGVEPSKTFTPVHYSGKSVTVKMDKR
jgi:alpha-D-xyloside xylohydrolase